MLPGNSIIADYFALLKMLSTRIFFQPSKETAYLCGAVGIYTVYVLHGREDKKSTQLLKRIIEVGSMMGSRDDYDDEMLNGRAGYLAADFELR